MNRRIFLGLFISLLLGFLTFFYYFSTPTNRLKRRLLDLGFEVDKKEIQKFWKAYFEELAGRIPNYALRYPWHFIREPYEERVKFFLLSSNALENSTKASIEFVTLYTPYTRPCFHPFLEKS